MHTPHPRDYDGPEPGDQPIPETDHHVGDGAGSPPRHTVESTGTRGGYRSRPAPPPPPPNALTTFQVVAAVSLGAVLAAGLAAAVAAVIGEDDEPEEKPRTATKRKAAAVGAAGAAKKKKKQVRKPVAGKKRVDINADDRNILTRLPGVGPAMADAIVKGRPFHMVDDLRKVDGIGPALLRQLRPRVKV